jgi:hypothetical protein
VNVDLKTNPETKLSELTFEVKKGRKGAIIEASVLNTPVEQ